MKDKKIYVGCKENGDFIEEVSSIEEGKKIIKKYEKQDKKEGIYQEDFYEIMNEEHCRIDNI